MRLACFTCPLLGANLISMACAQDIPSVISLLLGASTPSPSKGVDTSSFSWCIDQASFVASDLSQHASQPSFAATDVEGVAYGVCTENRCTSLGFTRLDKCCSIANSDYSHVSGTGTAAYNCLSSFRGTAPTQPPSASASTTGASGAVTAQNATTSSSSTSKGGQGALSPTSAPRSTTTGTSSSSASGASSSNQGNPQMTELYSSSVLALLVGLAAYIL